MRMPLNPAFVKHSSICWWNGLPFGRKSILNGLFIYLGAKATLGWLAGENYPSDCNFTSHGYRFEQPLHSYCPIPVEVIRSRTFLTLCAANGFPLGVLKPRA